LPHFDTRTTLLFISSFPQLSIVSNLVIVCLKNSERRWVRRFEDGTSWNSLRNVSKTQLINAEMLHNLVCTVAIETIHDSKQLYYTSKMTLWPLNLYDASFNWN